MKKARTKTKSTLLILILSLSLIVASIGVRAANEPDLYLYLNGTTSTSANITIGDTFNFSEYIDQNGDDAQAVKVSVNFTTNMNVTSGEEGPDNIWGSAFLTIGTITNDTGDGTGSVNYTQNGVTCEVDDGEIARFNAIGTEVGVATINWTYIKLDDCDVNTLDVFMHNATVSIHPEHPSGFSVISETTSSINTSWSFAPYSGVDNYVLYGSTTDSPTDRDPAEELYNSSDLSTVYYNHTGLDPGQKWYYTLWGYNATENMYSNVYGEKNATTGIPDYPPEITLISPSNTTTPKLEYTTSVDLQVSIDDPEDDTVTTYIECDGNNDTFSGEGTKTSTVSGLSAGTYTWYVNSTDGESYNRTWYQFTINAKPSGGGGGGGYNPSPSNGAPSVSITSPLSVNVTDADGDDITVKFFWQNNTQIGSDQTIVGGGPETVSVSPSLTHGVEYFWYVTAADGTETTTTDTWSFNTTTLGIDIDAAWTAVPANNTIYKWVNVTNTGLENLTNVDIWDRPSDYLLLDSYNHGADFSANGHYEWTIPYLNHTGENTYYNITMWFSLDSLPTNNQCFYNLVNVSHLSQTDSVNLTGLCYSYTANKSSNITYTNETITEVGWTIEIENTGDFTLNNVYVNETYDDCVNYSSSTIVSENPGTDTVFLIPSIAPSATSELVINTSITPECPENGTLLYNNATVNTSETASSITLSEYTPYGGYTTQVKIRYSLHMSDVQTYGDSVLSVLGVLLIIGAILLIVGVATRYGFLGGSE